MFVRKFIDLEERERKRTEKNVQIWKEKKDNEEEMKQAHFFEMVNTNGK